MPIQYNPSVFSLLLLVSSGVFYFASSWKIFHGKMSRKMYMNCSFLFDPLVNSLTRHHVSSLDLFLDFLIRLLFSSEHTTPILCPLKYMNCVQFQCNNIKKTVKKGQLVCLVYTIKLLCCIKSSVILRKFQSVLSLHIHIKGASGFRFSKSKSGFPNRTHPKCRFRKSTRFYLHILPCSMKILRVLIFANFAD